MEDRDMIINSGKNNELMPSVLKLMRAMRRRPMHHEHEFPPSVERMLAVLGENDGAAPSELCVIMDVRPSSMSELLSGMEKHELITRAAKENDKRATEVYLTDKGKEAAQSIAEKNAANNAKLAECFTQEELEQFCSLCDKLSAHLEGLSEGQEKHCGPCGHHGPHGHHGHRGPHGCFRHHGPFGPRG